MMEAVSAYGIVSRASRVRLRLDDRTWHTTKETVILLAAGALAAAIVAWMPLPLRVPGHVILKAAAPLILGVAMVPRPLAGSMAGLGAAAMLMAIVTTGMGHVQAAAATSLLALGPAIDLAIVGMRHERFSVYSRFAVAGLAANLLAFSVRWATASWGLDAGMTHRMNQLGMAAFVSFTLCGVLAGLFSAALLFRPRGSRPDDAQETHG